MLVPPKSDFRKTLNFMLGAYYQDGGIIIIHQQVEKAGLPIPADDLQAGFTTLANDGYIENLFSEYSSVPLGRITGKGRMFYEQGGYKDETTQLDKIIKWGKNNKVIAWVVIIVTGIAALKGVIDFVAALLNLSK